MTPYRSAKLHIFGGKRFPPPPAVDRDVNVYRWTRWSRRLKPGAKQEIHMAVLLVCDKPSAAVRFESNLFGWSQQKKKKKRFHSSLPKFCIPFREMLFLRALHYSQYVINFKKTRGWITDCIWPFGIMGLWSLNWLEWTTSVVVCWGYFISGTSPHSSLPASHSALLWLTLSKSQRSRFFSHQLRAFQRFKIPALLKKTPSSFAHLFLPVKVYRHT